jgi:hypothetical protein
MSRSRAYTRHQRSRAWSRMWRIITEMWRYVPSETAVRLTNHRYQHRQSCSCLMCRGERYHRPQNAEWASDLSPVAPPPPDVTGPRKRRPGRDGHPAKYPNN